MEINFYGKDSKPTENVQMCNCAVSKSVETAAGKKIKRQRIHLLILP